MFCVENINKVGYYLTLLLAISTSASVGLESVAMYLGLMLIIVRYAMDRSAKIHVERGIWTVWGIFFVMVAVSCLFSFDSIISFKALFKYSTRVVPFLLVIAFVRTKKQILLLIVLLSVSILISDSYALWQQLYKPGRPAAFFGNPIFFAGHLLQMFTLLIVVLFSYTDLARWQSGLFSGAALFTTAMLLCNRTRGAWVALVCVLIVMGIMTIKKNKKIAILLLLIFFVLGISVISNQELMGKIVSIFIMKADPSNAERFLVWESSWHMFLDHPFMGLGLEGFQYHFKSQYILPGMFDPEIRNSHNNIIAFLAETGIVGTFGYLCLFGFMLFDSYRRYKNNNENVWALAAFLLTLGVQIHGMTDFNFAVLTVMRLYWFIIGICYTGMRLIEQPNQQEAIR